MTDTISAPAALLLLLAATGCSDTLGPDLTPPVTPDTRERITAATTTAQNASVCTAIQPFYWEIGDKAATLGSASVARAGSAVTYTATSQMAIASASKLIYGAYVAERRGGALTAEDIQFLTFRSGYTNFSLGGCENGDTVADCVARSTNGAFTAANVGRFSYDGAHMQKHASLASPGMNLGPMANVALAAEVRRVLGNEIGLSYTQPQLAGGIRSSAGDYAKFLRKILNGDLRIAALLGSSKTCTNPATCPTAINTPIGGGVNWNYSIGHWVEDDPTTGDGSFSSAGAFGFYPWINADKTLYGIVARLGLPGTGEDSALCGARIRKAWVTGAAQ